MTFLNETSEQPALASEPDPISVGVGEATFIQSHRFANPNLTIETHLGRLPRLSVSRFYWTAQPPVAVDFVRDVRYGETEIAAKRTYCERLGYRYALVRDATDDEGLGQQLERYVSGHEEIAAVQNAAKPLLGPRRKNAQ